LPVIDADANVFERDRTCHSPDESEQHYTPSTVLRLDGTAIETRILDKIVAVNPRALYGL
jgi:hypothetical protein